MGTQAIIFTYEGQEPTREVIRDMAEALINSEIGINVATVQNHNLNELEYAQAIVAAGVKKPSKGVSIKIEKSKPALSKEDREKFLGFMSSILNG